MESSSKSIWSTIIDEVYKFFKGGSIQSIIDWIKSFFVSKKPEKTTYEKFMNRPDKYENVIRPSDIIRRSSIESDASLQAYIEQKRIEENLPTNVYIKHTEAIPEFVTPGNPEIIEPVYIKHTEAIPEFVTPGNPEIIEPVYELRNPTPEEMNEERMILEEEERIILEEERKIREHNRRTREEERRIIAEEERDYLIPSYARALRQTKHKELKRRERTFEEIPESEHKFAGLFNEKYPLTNGPEIGTFKEVKEYQIYKKPAVPMRISTVNYGPLAPSYTSVLHADNNPLEPLPYEPKFGPGVLEREAEIEKRDYEERSRGDIYVELLGNGRGLTSNPNLLPQQASVPKGSKIFPGSINRVVKGSYPKSVFPTYNPPKK